MGGYGGKPWKVAERSRPSVRSAAKPELKASAAPSLPAHAIAAAIHMEVIAMRRVVFGPEHAVEHAARPVADVAQKQRLETLAAPVALDSHVLAVCQREAGDVQRIGSRVSAHRGVFLVVDVP